MQNSMQLYISSVKRNIKDVLAKDSGFEFCDINVIKDSSVKAFNRTDVVYLTHDSNNVISTLDEDKIYVIGGLVDHKTRKRASLKRVRSLGVARLPTKIIDMKTWTTLTMYHVYELLSKVVADMHF